jgi:hypothetical protein
MLGRLRCLFMPHRPDNRRVKKCGEGHYYGYCETCGARIRRLRRNEWKRAWRWPRDFAPTGTDRQG